MPCDDLVTTDLGRTYRMSQYGVPTRPELSQGTHCC